MLGKLLKHELRVTGKILPISYLATLLLFLFGVAAKYLLPNNLFFAITPVILLVLSIIFILIFTYIITIMRFHKSMYGNEGYFTQTLPVSKRTILLSRILAFCFWIIISSIVVILGASGICFIVTGQFSGAMQILKQFYLGSPITTLYFLASLIIGAFLMAFEVFFAMSLANTSKFLKNNIAFSVVFYFVISIIQGIIDVLAMLFIPLSIYIPSNGVSEISTTSMFSKLGDYFLAVTNNSETASFPYIGIGNLFTEIILIVVLVLLTNYLLKNKINVK